MRSERKSGVDLSAAPFSIKAKSRQVLSDVPAFSPDVVYRTTAYAF